MHCQFSHAQNSFYAVCILDELQVVQGIIKLHAGTHLNDLYKSCVKWTMELGCVIVFADIYEGRVFGVNVIESPVHAFYFKNDVYV